MLRAIVLAVRQRARPAQVAALLTLVLCAGGRLDALAAERSAPSEDQVKAVFLYNFAKFVEWPADAFTSAAAPIVIGIVGHDPFGALLDDTTRGERINGREILVRRLDADDRLRECHIIFVSSSERERLPKIFDRLRGTSVLTVGEFDDFARNGGMIQFTKENHRIGFEINAGVAEREQLRISSKLLSLARRVSSAGSRAQATR